MAKTKTAQEQITMITSSKDLTEQYNVLQSLGEGKFGQVKEVQHKVSKKRFAWKRVCLEKDPLVEVEAQLLRRVKHRNIVTLHQAYTEDGVMHLMLELCKFSMADYIDGKFEQIGSARCYFKPNTYEISMAMQQLLEAVGFLHENQVAHRDIKPENVLMAAGSQWKLADFNLACEFDRSATKPMSEYAGTRPFMAPEVEKRSYTEKCDLYSMGVLFVCLVLGRQYVAINNGVASLLEENTWRERESVQALHFAKGLLAPEKERFDAEGAQKSPWLLNQCGGGCCVIC